MFPQLARFTDLGLLLMRLMIGVVFVASGYSHLKDPGTRGKSIGMGQGFTIFLGIAEVGGGLGVTFGVLTQLAAIGLILIMLGAIQKKIFVWHTGFWGWLQSVDLGSLGYVIVGLFAVAWGGALLIWKGRGIERRLGAESTGPLIT